MKTKKEVFKVGEQVQIVVPEFFDKCGYENNFESAYKIVKEKYLSKIQKFVDTIYDEFPTDFQFKPFYDYSKPTKLEEDILRAFAYDYVKGNKKQGNERKIFTRREDYYQDRIFTIHSKNVVYTGKYDKPYSTQSYEGEVDYYPGGLYDQKAHVILTLGSPDNLGNIYLEDLRIEKCNVKKVKDGANEIQI